METRFGRTTLPGDPKRKEMTSTVGAIGPMQFMDLTWIGWDWRKDHPNVATTLGDIPDSFMASLTNPEEIKKYNGSGIDGNQDGIADPWNEIDAIHAAANYIAIHGGAQGDYQKAILAYNKSQAYLQKVLAKVKQFRQPSTQQITGESYIWPVPTLTKITSNFGNRNHPLSRKMKQHQGIDIAGPGARGQSCYAANAGTVMVKQDPGGYGNYILIDHGNGYSTLYGHLDSVLVQSGQKVNRGQLIGNVGQTGGVTGPHLHFEIRYQGTPQDPLKWIRPS